MSKDDQKHPPMKDKMMTETENEEVREICRPIMSENLPVSAKLVVESGEYVINSP